MTAHRDIFGRIEEKMKKVLIFGDSNSWGYIPAKGERYPPDVRWPGIASKILGDGYELVEDSISGRTTVYEDPQEPKRCGIDCLGYVLAAHHPLDLVVLFLGTNDLKFTDIGGYRMGLTRLIETVLDAQALFRLTAPVFNGDKRLLVVGPPRINPEIARLRPEHRLSGAADASEKLSGVAREVAERFGASFVDVSALVFPDATDCLHLSREDHRKLGHTIADAIKRVFA